MTTTLNEIYRDVYSQLAVSGNEHDISSKDIVNAINQAIKSLRVDYVANGIGQYFTVEETINTFSADTYFPQLQVGSLANRIMSEVPISLAVLASNVKITTNTIQNTTQTFSEGDIAELDGILYEAIRDITAENTFNETFDARSLRNYYPNNGLKYFAGEIVYNTDDGLFYEVTTTFTAEGGAEELSEVVWRKIGNANKPANHYPLKELRNIILHGDEKQAISLVNDKIYVNDNVAEVHIIYVPEWTDVTTLDGSISIPDGMLPQVIELSRIKLLSKLAQKPQPRSEDE